MLVMKIMPALIWSMFFIMKILLDILLMIFLTYMKSLTLCILDTMINFMKILRP